MPKGETPGTRLRRLSVAAIRMADAIESDIDDELTTAYTELSEAALAYARGLRPEIRKMAVAP